MWLVKAGFLAGESWGFWLVKAGFLAGESW